MMLVSRTISAFIVLQGWGRGKEQAGAKGWSSPSRELSPWVAFLFAPKQSIGTIHRASFLYLHFSRSSGELSLPVVSAHYVRAMSLSTAGRIWCCTCNSERCPPLVSQEQEVTFFTLLPCLLPLEPRPISWACNLCSHIGPCAHKGPMLGPAVTILRFLIIFELRHRIFIFHWTLQMT